MTLVLRGLEIAVADRVLLATTDLELHPGATLAVVGPSGSGKTTTLATVAGLGLPRRGEVLLDGVATPRSDRRATGLVTQPVLLASLLTVAENVALPLQAAGRSGEQIRDRVDGLLERLSLTALADRQTSRLSGGQRQRVAVARAVAAQPALVIADEPTSELDPDSREHVVALLLESAAAGSVVVLSTHDDQVARRCDSILQLGAVRERHDPSGAGQAAARQRDTAGGDPGQRPGDARVES